MIEQISNIGKSIRSIEGEKELVELWTKDTKEMDNIIIIDINEETKEITKELVSFYREVYKDSLIYQQGNGHIGAGIKIEKYKEEESNKILKKVLSSLEFLELDKKYLENVWINIEKEVLKDIKQSYFIMLTKNNKTPRELFANKYEKEVKSLLKEVNNSNCYICDKVGKGYNTALFKCFTNDKKIYTNTDGCSFSICDECLINLLNGRSYINEYLRTNWIGSEVMFLPHEFGAEIKDIYETTIQKENKITSLIDNIRESEEMVLDIVAKLDCMTDIIFFNDPKSSSEWKITYAIRDIMPSRFSLIGKMISKYKQIDNYFSFYKIMSYLCYSDGKFDSKSSKNKDRMRLIDIIFNAIKYNRSLFFYNVMSKYKTKYFESLLAKKDGERKFAIKDIHEIYNFMCECGCLQNPWKMLNEEGDIMKYKNREEFFEVNRAFFDSDAKKAWFIMGQIYNDTIYQSKKYMAQDKNKINEETSHLEKNFFFSRKFNQTTFIIFANTCTEKLLKYGAYYKQIKEDIKEAKEYMVFNDKKLNNDEAKYIFFWGMDMLFEDDIKKKNINEEKLEDNGGEK